MRPSASRLASLLLAAAVVAAGRARPPLYAARQDAVADPTVLEREVVGKLSGAMEIRPGVTLTDRFTLEHRQEARTYLAGVLTRAGLTPERQDYSADGENVYAVIACGRPGAEAVVVGAHYDSVRNAPGANDDGTGVAAVAAVADAFGHAPPRTRDLIVVFFDQEERGLIGSRAFAQMIADEHRPVHAVHTIDQMGWDHNGNRAIELELPYEGAVELYRQAAARLKLDIPMFTTSETGSDHQSFRQLGFPAVGLTEEYHHGDTTPFIHKPGDTFDTVDFGYLASTTRLMIEALRILTEPQTAAPGLGPYAPSPV
jgi:Peptidase family M28